MEAKEYWKKYESGISYNSNFKPNYYESIKVHHDFYNGDQWQGVAGDEKLPHPTFNIIKRVVEFDIASLTSSDISVNVEPLEYNSNDVSEDELDTSAFINAEIKNIFEKWNMRSKKKDLLLDGAITGDMCAHFIFNANKKPYRGKFPQIKGEIEMELIDCVNVIFGNPNIRDVEKQPWIIIVGRDVVKNLKEEAKKNQDNIKPDNDTEYQSSDFADAEIEIEEDNEKKALYIYYYEKKKVKQKVKRTDELTQQTIEVEEETEKVFVSKCTKDAIIYENVDLGTTRYPIAFSNWFKQKNTFHGRGMVEGIEPNQIAINKLFAMVIYHQMMTAFPTAVYDGDVIKSWSNEIGTAFKLNGTAMKGRSLKDVAGYLEPANMSEWIVKIIDLAFQYTKECLGVSDAALGQIDPKNTSAIIAVQKSTAVPLENIKDNLYDLIEQIVLILLDMMAAKYGNRPVVVTKKDGSRIAEMFDFAQLKDMDLKTSVDVGETTYYSEIAAVQTLDNLLQNGMIEMIDYLERIPKEMIPRKEELIAKIKEKEQVVKEQGYAEMAEFVAILPPQLQQKLQEILGHGWDVISNPQPQASGELVSANMEGGIMQ